MATESTFSVFVPAGAVRNGKFGALEAAREAVLTLVGADHESFPIADLTVISATLGDGREGGVVGVVFGTPPLYADPVLRRSVLEGRDAIPAEGFITDGEALGLLREYGLTVSRWGSAGWVLEDAEGCSLQIASFGGVAPTKRDAVAEGVRRIRRGDYAPVGGAS